jgi:hypothetical protein
VKLEFEARTKFGKVRFYPISDSAKAVLLCTKQSSLTKWQIDTLRAGDFIVEVRDQPG